jgi:hypothetical protein
MRVWIKVLCVSMLVTCGFGFQAHADEVTDQIKEGLDYYQKGSYSEAVNALNFAVGQIQQMQASGLKNVFPEPLKGWKAEESTGQFGAASFMGGGVSASRRYYMENGDKEVNIEIVTDSPLLQSVMMFYSNPAFFSSQPGTKLVKIQGRKAVQKFDPQNREGEINLIIGSRMLVTIKGQSLEKVDDVLAYANAIQYDALEKLLEK